MNSKLLVYTYGFGLNFKEVPNSWSEDNIIKWYMSYSAFREHLLNLSTDKKSMIGIDKTFAA